MQIAQILSGFTAGEADILRRAMGKKKRSELEKQKQDSLLVQKKWNSKRYRSWNIYENQPLQNMGLIKATQL